MSAISDAFNKQINNELYSSYLYLAMSTYCADAGFAGFSNWLRIQAQEELIHATRMYDFVLSRGMQVELKAIAAPKSSWDSPLQVMQEGLTHEKFITASLNELSDLTISEKDHASRIFLSWYVTEQVEEEQNFTDIINSLKIVKGEGQGLLMLDRELGTRTLTTSTDTSSASA